MKKQWEIIDVDNHNVDACTYCGANPLGHMRKREWIRQCLPDGLRYKIVRESATTKTIGMIEYMPSESAWRAVQATNYFVIHCVQAPKKYTGQGIGTRLIQECIRDAQKHHMNGIVALATQDGWCADKRIFLKNGFEVVDRATPALELMALTLRKSPPPTFGYWKRRAQALGPGVFMYNSKQCPFMRGDKAHARQAWLKSKYSLDATVIEVNDCRAAQANPCVWGTAGIVCNGEIINYVPGGDAHLVNKLKQLKVIS